jgi:hypothetical protein
MTAAEALHAWLEHLAHERRLSPRTLEAYGHIGRLYVAFLERHRGETLTLKGLGTITAAEVRAHLADRRSGDHPLAARSLSQTLSAVRGFHAFLDRRLDTPAPQVVIEVMIAEVTLTDGTDIGVNLFGTETRGDGVLTGSTEGLTLKGAAGVFNFIGPDYRARIVASASNNRVSILQRPQLVTRRDRKSVV